MNDKPINYSGLIYYSTPKATVGLVVQNGVIIGCPPYARKWALGRNAGDIWRKGILADARLHWTPD